MEAVGEFSRPNDALLRLAEALAFFYRNITKGITSFSKNSTRGKNSSTSPVLFPFISDNMCKRMYHSSGEMEWDYCIKTLFILPRAEKAIIIASNGRDVITCPLY